MRIKEIGLVRSLCVLAVCAPLALAAGCPRRSGPLEQAGEEIDDAVEDIEEEVDEATE